MTDTQPDYSSGLDGPARFGRIVDHRHVGGGATGNAGAYTVQDEADGRAYSFDYTDIVTEGFRNLRTGERVRFHVPAKARWRAEFVIRLDQPDPETYYT